MSDIIGSNPLTQILQQQGIPLSALAQISPSSNNFNPDLQVPPNPPMPNIKPMAQMGAMPQGAVGAATPQNNNIPGQVRVNPSLQAKAPKPPSEGEMITKVLMDRLQTLNQKELNAKPSARRS